MTRLAKCFAVLVLPIALAGCDNSEERKDVGYNDGYDVGYATSCNLGSPLIDGDFKNPSYAAAYVSGQTDGSMACKADMKLARDNNGD